MDHTQAFKDRVQAGGLLAQRLQAYAKRPDVIVLALPRGGVPVGFCVAQALEVALDVLIVRKLGMPGHEEYAMGAIASGGWCVLQDAMLAGQRIPQEAIDAVKRRELLELERREQLYRANRPAPQLRRRTVILVDDGLATGSTMLAAVRALRQAEPARIVVAVPVAAAETCRELGARVDQIICLRTPEPFHAVGKWYQNFDQTTDQEVISLLEKAEREQQQRVLADAAAHGGSRPEQT